jgi:hypothetical protein
MRFGPVGPAINVTSKDVITTTTDFIMTTWDGRVELCSASERRAQRGYHWHLLRREARHRNSGDTPMGSIIVNEAAHVSTGRGTAEYLLGNINEVVQQICHGAERCAI